jgi:hypothetical protein
LIHFALSHAEAPPRIAGVPAASKLPAKRDEVAPIAIIVAIPAKELCLINLRLDASVFRFFI